MNLDIGHSSYFGIWFARSMIRCSVVTRTFLICLFQANFARAVASLSKAQAKKVARFLPNPERHWGPKLRAGRTITSKHVSLLGPEAINGALNQEDEEEPKSKKPRTEDTVTS